MKIRKLVSAAAVFFGLVIMGFSTAAFACEFCIEKSADYSELTLSPGEQFQVMYTITLTQTGICYPEAPSSASIYDTNLPINPGYERMCSDLPAAFLDWIECVPSPEGAPVTFTRQYTKNIGPFYECGDYTVTNTACLPDWATAFECATDSWTITVRVPCEGGCTLTQGYWKTHSRKGPAPYDDAWALLGAAEENTPFYISGQSYHDVLWTAPKKGGAYYILGHQFIAAKLNILNGASSTPDVRAAIAWAETFFSSNAPDTDLSKMERKNVVNYINILDDYNNSYIGPGHCSE